uniref:Putative secreted protein n=1 Tax=Amblyomma tuberculatum TaxID=48802 RepID=A0A6M2E1Z2_9ACAR
MLLLQVATGCATARCTGRHYDIILLLCIMMWQLRCQCITWLHWIGCGECIGIYKDSSLLELSSEWQCVAGLWPITLVPGRPIIRCGILSWSAALSSVLQWDSYNIHALYK